MNKHKLSKNFWLYEFGGVMPDTRLLSFLQGIRDLCKMKVTISASKRTPREQVNLYKKLSFECKIKTIENGLGDMHLIDIIPFGSRHLPSFNTINLRAADFQIKYKDEYMKGEDILNEYIMPLTEKLGNNIGVGLLSNGCHLDIDREVFTKWGYSY